MTSIDTVVLDIDGTLVDSVYQHTLAWTRAFQAVGLAVPSWRLHRAIGLGGDRLVTEVAGQAAEQAVGDDVRAEHDREYQRLFPSVHVLPGAERMISTLKDRGLLVAVASSGSSRDAGSALDLLEDGGRADLVVTGDDGYPTKPAPELLTAAVEKVGGRHAVALGDAIWDVHAAKDGGLRVVGLLTGGFSEAELREAGADAVEENPSTFLERLEDLLGA